MFPAFRPNFAILNSGVHCVKDDSTVQDPAVVVVHY